MTNIPQPLRRFTTFEVARICGVYHTTVINWVKKGQLKALQTPGKHRRILLPDLLEFMRRFEMPIPEGLAAWRKKVLVVEDEEPMRRILVRHLGRLADVEVAQTDDGMKALLMIGQAPPDLLVLDVGIPNIDGLRLIELVRAAEHSRPVKVIVVTGKDLDARELDFVRENAEECFGKPFDGQAFLWAASRALDVELPVEEAAR